MGVRSRAQRRPIAAVRISRRPLASGRQPRNIPRVFRECVIGVPPAAICPPLVTPSRKSHRNAFAPLSRGQANTKALALGRGHEPAAASAGAKIFVSSMTFATLGLAEPLLRALDEERFLHPTPIQATAIPHLLAGRDLLGIAQTGTGKTAAFALPMLQHLAAQRAAQQRFATRALILAPTRELALQIEDSLHRLGSALRFRVVAILGGVSRSMQVQRMRSGADIVVGTPGRICDLMATGELRLNQVSHFVLDEADRMLDLGFIRDILRIVAALPAQRQSSLFSATMPAEVATLAETLLRDPARVDVAISAPARLPIAQYVHFVDAPAKRALLQRLLADPAMSRVIVFTRTKRSADRVAEALDTGGIPVSALHGNKSQPARLKALEQFRSGHARVLVATDIAARGIDVTGVSHVVNFDLPAQPEDYVHRIGRTARAGAAGVAISFCDAAEHGTLRALQRMTGAAIAIAGGTPPAQQPGSGPGQPGRGQTRAAAPHRPRRRHRGQAGLRPAA
jgi:ATP-dependent RNA helicase RhlE